MVGTLDNKPLMLCTIISKNIIHHSDSDFLDEIKIKLVKINLKLQSIRVHSICFSNHIFIFLTFYY